MVISEQSCNILAGTIVGAGYMMYYGVLGMFLIGLYKILMNFINKKYGFCWTAKNIKRRKK